MPGRSVPVAKGLLAVVCPDLTEMLPGARRKVKASSELGVRQTRAPVLVKSSQEARVKI